MNRRAIMAQLNDDVRRAVLTEMRQADQLAALAGRDTQETRDDLERWTSEGRMLSVQHEGVAYFALFALNPADLYPPYLAVADAVRILSEVLDRERNSWGIASWFLGVKSFLDDQRPADLLGSDPEWVTEAAQDEVDSWKYPHG